jgi:DNA polymerase-3 subunit delta
MDSSLKKIKKKFGEMLQGINYIIIDETLVDDIIYNIESPAFGYDKKLIIVKNSGLFKKDGRKKQGTPIQEKLASYIMENMDIINESVNIVFVEDEVDKNCVYEAIDKNGIICNFEELNQMQLIKRLKQIAVAYKVNIPDNVIAYLIECSGSNMQFLINEIRKLIEFAGPNGTVQKEDVDKLAIKQIDSVIFDLTDDLGSKKINEAIEVLDGLIYQKEPLQKILVTLYNHFKKLYLCRIAIESGKDIIVSLGLKPNQTFLVGKYKKQASSFSKETLKKILEEITALDYNSKNGKIDIDVGLRSILCCYCK